MTHSKDIAGLLEAAIVENIVGGTDDFPSINMAGLIGSLIDLPDQIAALRPAADPKAEGVVDEPAGPLTETLSNERLTNIRDNADNGTAVRIMAGELLIARQRLAAPPTPDAERAGEPPRDGSWVLLRTNLRPSVEARWGALNEDGEGWISADGFWALEEGEDVTGYSQSPATEAVSEAMVEADAQEQKAGWRLSLDYLDSIRQRILSETGYDATSEVIEAALLIGNKAALIRPPVGADGI